MLRTLERNVRTLFFILVILSSCNVALGQSTQPTPSPRSTPESRVDSANAIVDPILTSADIAKLPVNVTVTKPKLTLQRALKISEAYMRRQKFGLSFYFLLEVRLIQWGAEQSPKDVRWFFHWVSAKGPPVEMTVSMTGAPSRVPSM